jgi:hypothetical protein
MGDTPTTVASNRRLRCHGRSSPQWTSVSSSLPSAGGATSPGASCASAPPPRCEVPNAGRPRAGHGTWRTLDSAAVALTLSPCIPARYRARDPGCARSCCVKAEAACCHRSAGSRPYGALILRAACQPGIATRSTIRCRRRRGAAGRCRASRDSVQTGRQRPRPRQEAARRVWEFAATGIAREVATSVGRQRCPVGVAQCACGLPMSVVALLNETGFCWTAAAPNWVKFKVKFRSSLASSNS